MGLKRKSRSHLGLKREFLFALIPAQGRSENEQLFGAENGGVGRHEEPMMLKQNPNTQIISILVLRFLRINGEQNELLGSIRTMCFNYSNSRNITEKTSRASPHYRLIRSWSTISNAGSKHHLQIWGWPSYNEKNNINGLNGKSKKRIFRNTSWK